MGPPAQIVQMPDKVVFLYATNLFRLIPIGAAHRTDIDTSYMGDSVAKWDGDALVVDVNNLNDDTWLGPDGYFHTEAMHVVERFTRTGDAINYQVTVEDPNVFTQPWVMNARTLRLGNRPLEEGSALRREGRRAPRDAGSPLKLPTPNSQLPSSESRPTFRSALLVEPKRVFEALDIPAADNDREPEDE